MTVIAAALVLLLAGARDALSQPDASPTVLRFSGASAEDELCKCLLEARRRAESDGRLDFAVEIDSIDVGHSTDLVARLRLGTMHTVRRIHFSGHSKVNDSTLRRAMALNERDLLDIRKLKKGLARINSVGLFEPITLDDVRFDILEDGVSTDLTIALRARRTRWWSLSAPIFPMRLQASVASRLPSWGRGVFEVATYFVSLNMAGWTTPLLALHRPLIPGQELLSGFVISPWLSPRSMLWQYGRSHAALALGGMLDGDTIDALVVATTQSSASHSATITCKPPRRPLWWLRLGGAAIVKVMLMA